MSQIKMPPLNFPLRWESTGDQWWYVSPIDYAAANGQYDVVKKLLHIDPNLIIKLTSLRRTRRLETVWDDESPFNEVVPINRSQVAKQLFMECERKNQHNSLIRAGYGGWVLYTAASAGDLGFVKELLNRDPILVFGEGEYGVTDVFFAAARSKNSEVFRLVMEFSGVKWEIENEEVPEVFRSEMMNRAIHAAARGGNLEMMKELIEDCSDVLSFRDSMGSTVLHTASGRGQVEVVKDLLSTYNNIITSTDNQGNTALSIAAYRGQLAVVEVLIRSSPSTVSLTNNFGDTFLHMAVAGFRAPGFQRLDNHIRLINQLVSGKIVNIEDIVNVKNNDGRTVLHMAVIKNIHTDLIELLMTVPGINVNLRDADRLTPLDLLKQRRKSESTEVLIQRLISAGGISNSRDYMERSAIVSHLKMQGVGASPGTSFRIPDEEILLYSDANCDTATPELSACSSELTELDDSASESKSRSMNDAARRLKILLRWAVKKESSVDDAEVAGDDSLESNNTSRSLSETPTTTPTSPRTPTTSLRQRFSKSSSSPNNKRIFSARSNGSFENKLAIGLMRGVIQSMPRLAAPRSHSSPLSEASRSSNLSTTDDIRHEVSSGPSTPIHPSNGVNSRPSNLTTDDIRHEVSSGASTQIRPLNGVKQLNRKQTSFKKRLMNQYLCFRAQGLAVGDSSKRFT